jgi:hypothetical protein
MSEGDGDGQDQQQSPEQQTTTTTTKISFSSTYKTLQGARPTLVLPPYDARTDVSAALEQDLIATPGDGTPTTSETQTTYKGRMAENIAYEILQPVNLQGNSQYAYPINEYEDGEIEHFTVSTNSDQMRVVCILYDDRNRPTTICNETARELVIRGRGMTLAQALARDQDDISLDNPSTPHNRKPYVARYKDTFSLGFHDPSDYNTVVGTEDDKHYVIEYAPASPRAYKKIYFNVQNLNTDARVIHYLTVSRFAFEDRYDYSGPITQQDEEQLQAARARKGRLLVE